ncbi:hypothetical protein G9A89_020149 [Geosiphon pyriformis]|nr:hypothetical protein G9A89_020149 [Geosiphon pyriformis]
MGDTVSKRQIDQRLPLILVINVTGISTINEKRSLQNKDLPEEINFPKGNQITKQRYRLMGVSFCNDIHHIADVRFENFKNSGWYQYDGLQKTYKARAMAIGSRVLLPKLTCLSNNSITRLNFPFKVVPLSLVDFTGPLLLKNVYLSQISLDTITGFTGFYPIAGFTNLSRVLPNLSNLSQVLLIYRNLSNLSNLSQVLPIYRRFYYLLSQISPCL